MHKAIIKIVFTNNKFNEFVDIFSLPIISTILSSPNFTPEDYLHYEIGCDYPHNLRDTYGRTPGQFELVELVYRQFKFNDDDHQQQRDTSCYRESKRVRRTDQLEYEEEAAGFELFQKEITLCLLKNNRILRMGTRESNRFCYVNTSLNISGVGGSLPITLIDFLDGAGKISPGSIGGYLKIFSDRGKRNYLESLNYRYMQQHGLDDKISNNHLPHLQNHLIVYFDVQKYYLLNTAYIFNMSMLKRTCNINCYFGGSTGPTKACGECLPKTLKRNSETDEENFIQLQHILNTQVRGGDNYNSNDEDYVITFSDEDLKIITKSVSINAC